MRVHTTKNAILSCLFYSCVYKNAAIDRLRAAFTKRSFKADLELRFTMF